MEQNSFNALGQSYDVIICGTGLVESVVALLLARDQKQVLQIDRNSYYGGEGATLDLKDIKIIFDGDIKEDKQQNEAPKEDEEQQQKREWYIDSIPKYIFHSGNLVSFLISSKANKFLEFKGINEILFFKDPNSSQPEISLVSVPIREKDILKSPLFSAEEQKRLTRFTEYIQDYPEQLTDPDPSVPKLEDPENQSFNEVTKYFKLQPNTIEILVHVFALQENSNYKEQPSKNLLQRLKTLIKSVENFGEPFLYAIGSNSKVSDSIVKRAVSLGEKFFFNKEIEKIIIDETGVVKGVEIDKSIISAPVIVCDPSYVIRSGLKQRLAVRGKIVRCICVLDHPVLNLNNGKSSALIVIPHQKVGRQTDIYVGIVSSQQYACPKGMFVAHITTKVETDNPQFEIQVALEILSPISQKFIKVSEILEEAEEGKFKDGLFISQSYSTSPHCEDELSNAFDIYQQITGKDADTKYKYDDDDDDEY